MKEMKNNSIVETASVLKHALSRIMQVRDIPLAITRLLFIKYALDNYIGADNVEKMQIYAQAQKMLALRDTTGLSLLTSVLECIDEAYGFDLILSEPMSIELYEAALFHENHINQKRNITDEMFKDVMDVLGRIDLQEMDKDSHTAGEEVAEYLLAEINRENKAALVRKSGFTTTSQGVNVIVKGLLKVSPTDTFCDFTAGLGISTIGITKDVKPKVIIADIERSYLAVATMFLIMYGYKNISAIAGNTLEGKIVGVHGNKIFVDPPLMNKIRREGDNRRIEASHAVVEEVVRTYLDEKGIAVVAVPSGFLFKTDRASKEARINLMEKGFIKAVIGLPPMWAGTNIGTNLLVLEKGKAHEQILLVDASYEGRGVLNDETVEKIIETVRNPKAISGFSHLIKTNEAKARDYNLVPASYITPDDDGDLLTVREIDKELNSLYELLSK